ncbi:MAG: hypothetical protein QOD63_2080, partial [Actinomycetota bacterium]|nr:hypothetical protein [Actinomycetota bacterium]
MTKLFPARVDPAAAGKETLAIVSRPDAEALVPPGHRFDLVYPATWRSPYPDGNIYSAAFESATIDWLGRFGLVTDERDLETVRKFSCGRYGGYSSPRSSFRDGLLLTQYVSLWLFWDDRVVEEGLGWSVNDIVAALVEPQVPDAADGFARAWHDLCVRLRRTQSDRWLLRLAIDMEAWMRNAKLETANAARYQSSGELPDFEALLAIRTISIGMYPTFHLIEMAEGLELPDGFHDDPFVRELKRLASALVGYGNDLGGFAKDCLATWPNLVTAMKEQADLGTVDAFR